MRFAVALILFLLFVVSCSTPPQPRHQLAITNATVFNSVDGSVQRNKTIVIDSGYITGIVDAGMEIAADCTLDAQHKLVTPGFIDAVGHLDDVFGDRPDTLKLSVDQCVKKFSETYLPYGVTTVRNSGDGTGYYAIADYLRQNHSADVPDFYFSGGSIAGWYDGSPYINHLLVQDSSEAAYWIGSEAASGSVNSIKLYCNGPMNYSTFTAALRKAQSLELNVTAQVQNEITIDSALSLGLLNFEHASTLCYQRDLFNFSTDEGFNDTLKKYWHNEDRGSRIYPFLEAANYSWPDSAVIIATIKNMAAHHATMTTSLHFFAQWLGKTWFCSAPKASRFDCTWFSGEQKLRCEKGYEILSRYVKRMYDEGVTLAIGTDHRDGGKAVLSEILLLNETGIPMEACLQIATGNTASTIGMDTYYGTIEPGKRADLIVFDKNPLEASQNLLEHKTIIKDGEILP